jgi:Peptidase family M1 domain/Peptidase M1 N-terminal domain
MKGRGTAVVAALLCAALLPGAVSAAGPSFSPGAAGAGDPYYPLDGNGGYDVKHYDLDLDYQPDTDILTGIETISARATQDLSSFDLDLVGLNVRSIKVDGRRATWIRDGQELIITPRHGLPKNHAFKVVIRYDGVPEPTLDPFGGESGFVATDDGAIIAGEPHGAATWFPANDHPIDKASFSFKVSVPRGLQVVANGKLTGRHTHHGETTWSWNATEPMATYLATVNIGEFDIHAYRKNGIRYWDAVDPDLLDPVAAPTTGSQFALSGQADSSYKRLLRTIHIPAGGATVGFTLTRDTEPEWDFVFVEVHTVGLDDWTTLPDVNGHTSDDTGFSCPFGGWQAIHPFLAHYQTDNGDGTCTPTGTSGTWSAATGAGAGVEDWLVNVPATTARDVELSISYASDEIVQHNGAFVDDIVVSTGEGNTSFEADSDPLDGWTVPGAPATSPGNANDWFVGTVADAPPSAGAVANGSFAREPEIIGFLAKNFGPYPFSAAGGIVDDVDGLGFALETQTRPIYSKDFFTDAISGDDVVVHELAHMWYGDSLAVARWQHIWLNEGFATYAEWLWSEREGLGTAQENFDGLYNGIPDDDPFWALTIGDPGPGDEFDFPVYARGAMTLQQLRLTVGDHDFFKILKRWAKTQKGGNVTTDQFIALAEKVSGQDLGDLFETWLFTPTKPVLPVAALRTMTVVQHHVPAAARTLIERYGQDLVARLTK